MVWNQVPVAADRTLQTFNFYFLKEVPNESQREAIRYLDQDLQPEDIAILESVQHGVHHFHCLLLVAL